MKPFRKNRLSLSIAMAAASFSASAVFAETETGKSPITIEEVVVTGMRASLAKSLDIKRDSTGVVDAIVAEDIGKFPASNVADALQRIPGITLSRDGASNEGNRISIRGLGSQYSVTTINGAPVHTTSTSNVGGSVRDFNYDVFPSDLFSVVKVYKTPMAELSEGGIGGVVDLQTPRPFDNPDQQIHYAVSGGYNTASEAASPRGSFLYSNTWGDFGASVAVAVGNSTNVASGFQSTGGYNNSRQGSLKPAVGHFSFALDYTDPRANFGTYTKEQVDNAFMPRFSRAYASENDRERGAGVFSLQYKNEKLDVSLDGIASELKDTTDEYTHGVAIRNAGTQTGVKGLVPIDIFIDRNNNLQGTFGNTTWFSESFIYDSKTQVRGANLRADYLLTDTLKLSGQVTHSKSDAEYTNNRIFNQANLVTATINSSKNSVYPTIASATDFTNPTSWNLKPDVNFALAQENDQDDMARLLIQWDYGVGDWAGVLKSGLNYVESHKEEIKRNGTALAKSRTLSNGKSFTCPTPTPMGCVSMSVADFAPYMQSFMPIKPYAKDAGDGFPKTWSTYSRAWIEDFLDPFSANAAATLDFNNVFTTEEDVTSYFFQNEIHGDVFQRDLKINLGVRFADTKTIIENYKLKQTVDTQGNKVTAYAPNVENGGYDNTLPSINLAYDLSDDVILRSSWGKTITRANLINMAGNTVVPNRSNPVARTGNPSLLPETSSQYDFTVEWYASDSSMLSVGAFRKTIRDQTLQTDIIRVPFSSLGLPDSALTTPLVDMNGNVDPNLQIDLTTYYNGGKYAMSGLEFAYQLDFDFLPAPFDSFGTLANYTLIDTQGKSWTGNSGVKHEIWSVPKNAYSLTGYYEKGAFSSRLSYSYKGKTINDTFNYSDLQRWHAAVGYLDASVGYKFNDYLELKLDALNLNNELAYDYFSNPEGKYGTGFSRLENAKYYGRTYMLGIRGSF